MWEVADVVSKTVWRVGEDGAEVVTRLVTVCSGVVSEEEETGSGYVEGVETVGE